MPDFYTKSGNPPLKGDVKSAPLRAEFALIEAAFLKFAQLTGNAGKPVFVNAAESGYECKTAEQARTALAAEGTANKDATDGYVGLTDLKINFKNTAGTFYSFFTNANTASRTYTFPDQDGTVMMAGNSLTYSGSARVSPTEFGAVITGTLTVTDDVAIDGDVVITGGFTCTSLTIGNTITGFTTTMGNDSGKVPVESAIQAWLSSNGFYKMANIIGAVSQSGGVPTGALFFDDSNANGYALLFANGWQICLHTMTSDSLLSNTPWVYPYSFSSILHTNGVAAQGNANFNFTIGAPNTAQVSFNVHDASGTKIDATVYLIAIGRWF